MSFETETMAVKLAWNRLTISRDERGVVSMETVIWVAVLATVAIGAGAIIVAKIRAKASSITTE